MRRNLSLARQNFSVWLRVLRKEKTLLLKQCGNKFYQKSMRRNFSLAPQQNFSVWLHGLRKQKTLLLKQSGNKFHQKSMRRNLSLARRQNFSVWLRVLRKEKTLLLKQSGNQIYESEFELRPPTNFLSQTLRLKEEKNPSAEAIRELSELQGRRIGLLVTGRPAEPKPKRGRCSAGPAFNYQSEICVFCGKSIYESEFELCPPTNFLSLTARLKEGKNPSAKAIRESNLWVGIWTSPADKFFESDCAS